MTKKMVNVEFLAAKHFEKDIDFFDMAIPEGLPKSVNSSNEAVLHRSYFNKIGMIT